MSNKNDFPSWLDAPDPGGDENDHQPENDVSADSGDLPPWLNPQANAEEAASDEGGDLPPWLQGEDPPVVYNFGGAELSEEYLSGGDQLIDRHESDVTYDEWVAQQAEDLRPKSIDEEIPDLISDIPDTGSLTGKPTGSTGKLPEWFLGLEELDESDIPDWFKDAQEIEPPPGSAPGEIAPWMMDLVPPEPPAEPQPSAMIDDDVETFFSSMGSGFRLEEDEPVVDWFATTTGNELTSDPDDDFFAQFGVKPPPPPAPPPNTEPVLSDDDWLEQSSPVTPAMQPSSDLPDEEFYAQFIEPPAAEVDLPDVTEFVEPEIVTGSLPPLDMDEADEDHPSMDLPDDLFAAVAKSRGQTPDIEDPDVSWFLNVPQTGGLPAFEDDIAAPTQIRRPSFEESSSLSWLSELENIVSSATSEPEVPSMIEYSTAQEEDPWAVLREPEPEAPAGEYDWGGVAEQPVEPEPESAPLDWLNDIEEQPAETVAEEPPTDQPLFTAPPTTPPRAPMSGLLQRASEPEPLDEAWNDVPEPAEADLLWEQVPEPDDSQVDPVSFTDMLRDFKLDADDLAAPETDWEMPAIPADMVEDPGVEQINMEDFLRGLDLEPGAAAVAEAAQSSFTDMLRGLQDTPRFEEQPDFTFDGEDDETHIPDDELYSGWLTDDLLADDDEDLLPAAEPIIDTDDFFALIEKGIDHNVIAGDETLFEQPTFEDVELPDVAALSAEPTFQLPSTDDLRLQFGDELAAETPAPEPTFQLPSTDDLRLQFGDEPELETPDEDLAFELPTTGDLRQQFGEPSDEDLAFELPTTGDLRQQFGEPADEDLAFELPTTGDLRQQFGEPSDEDLAFELPATGDLSFGFDELSASPNASEEPAFDFETAFAEFEAAEQPSNAQPEPEDFHYELPSFAHPEVEIEQQINALDDQSVEFPEFGWEHIEEESENVGALEVQAPPSELLEDVSDLFEEAPPQVEGWVHPEEEELLIPQGLPNTSELFSMFDELEEVPDQPSSEDELFAADVDWLGNDDYVERMRENSLRKTDALPDFDSLFGAADPSADDLSMFEPEAAPDYNAEELFASFDAVSEMNDLNPSPLPKTGPLPVFDAVSAFESDGDTGALAFEIDDIDIYLQSLDGPEVKKQTGDFFAAQEDIDLDELFDQNLMADAPEAPPNPDLEGLAPGTGLDWLGANVVGSVSAGAIARQMGDSKTPDELTDRLKKLRQRAEQLPEEEDANWITDSLAYVLPGVISTLAPAPLRTDELNPVGSTALTLSSEQTEHVNLLRSMLALDIKPQKLNAIELTYDSPFAPDIADHPDTIVHDRPEDTPVIPVAVAKPHTRRQLPLERWLIVALVLGAVLGPYFIANLRIGDLPLAAFAADSRGGLAFARVEALRPGDLVLIGAEYGATAAGELDLMTDSLLRHALLRGARPVIISGNPVTLLRVNNLFNTINTDAAFLDLLRAPDGLRANFDYFVVRYLPGSVLGLRAFSEDTAAFALTNIQGQATGLFINSLDDFALIALIAERPEDVRAYAEQVAPLVGVPLIAAVSYSASPIAEPYADSTITSGSPIAGLLVGYGDAYTYSNLLAGVTPVPRSRVPELPTAEPTPVQPELPQIAPVEPQATAEATPEGTTAGEEAPAPDEVFAVVASSGGTVRVRSGPGTNFEVVDNLPTGTRVVVLGFNEAGDWVNVRLEDNSEGWISASLLEIEGQTTPKRGRVGKPVQQDDPTPEVTAEATATRRPSATPRPTRTAQPAAVVTAEVTAEATVEVTAEAASAFTLPPTLAARDARWYSQTLGTLVIATLIAAGAVINLIRALFQRRRSS